MSFDFSWERHQRLPVILDSLQTFFILILIFSSFLIMIVLVRRRSSWVSFDGIKCWTLLMCSCLNLEYAWLLYFIRRKFMFSYYLMAPRYEGGGSVFFLVLWVSRGCYGLWWGAWSLRSKINFLSGGELWVFLLLEVCMEECYLRKQLSVEFWSTGVCGPI